LAISGANSADIVAASSVNLTVTAPAGSEHTDYATGGSAAIAVRSFQFDDYNADASVVRLYVNMTAGVDASWNFTHTFTINLVIGDATYAGTVTFTANAYVAA
ncbi:MAG: hypothetical protein K6F32_01230, partial [Bacilli bacterium]|nr:hypothetical protein [Bacilli bacterium]